MSHIRQSRACTGRGGTAALFLVLVGYLFFANLFHRGPLDVQAAPPRDVPGEATAAQVDEFIRRLNTLPSPEAALLSISEFESVSALSATAQKRLNAQKERYSQIHKEDKVRLGTEWVNPTELRAAVVSYNEEIDRAFSKLQKRDGKGFLTSLRKATTIYPNGFRARFILGMAYSARGNLNPLEAEKHFQSVLERSPTNLPAMNNLALTQFRVGNYGEAFGTWKRLLDIAPDFPDAVHNVTRIVREVEAQRVVFPDSTSKKKNQRSRANLFRDLADSSLARSSNSSTAVRPGVGWLYSPMLITVSEKQSASTTSDPSPQLSGTTDHDAIVGTTGTGLVVAPNVILTARSTVFDDYLGPASEVRLYVPRGAKVEMLTGKVRSISDADDLALIDVVGVEGSVVSGTDPKAGAEIQIVSANPEFCLKGEPTISKGKVQRLAATPNSALLAFQFRDSISPGSPVLDADGRLLGLCTSAYAAGMTGDRRTAISVGTLMQRLTTWDVALPGADAANSPAGRAAATPTITRVAGVFSVDPIRLQESMPAELRNERSELEDQSCLRCNGLGFVQCQAPGCAQGGVTVTEWYNKTTDLGVYGKMTQANTKVSKAICRTCNGDGQLTCPICGGRRIHPDIK